MGESKDDWVMEKLFDIINKHHIFTIEVYHKDVFFTVPDRFNEKEGPTKAHVGYLAQLCKRDEQFMGHERSEDFDNDSKLFNICFLINFSTCDDYSFEKSDSFYEETDHMYGEPITDKHVGYMKCSFGEYINVYLIANDICDVSKEFESIFNNCASSPTSKLILTLHTIPFPYDSSSVQQNINLYMRHGETFCRIFEYKIHQSYCEVK